MRALILPMMLPALLAGCGTEANKPPEAAKTLSVSDAWVRLAAVPGRPGAAYFTVHGGNAPERLVKIESDKVATIELHQTGGKDGVMTMAPLATADIPAGGTLAFAPGGNHAMLFGVDPGVTVGGTLPLRMSFASGATLSADAKVVAAGGDAPPAHAH